MRQTILLCAGLLCLTLPDPGTTRAAEADCTVAASAPSPCSAAAEEVGPASGWVSRTFDTTLKHDVLSRSLETMSLRLDSFFASEQFYQEDYITDSYASVKLSGSYSEEEGAELKPRVRLRIDLPRTERRFKLRFELEDDEYDENELGARNTGTDSLQDNDVNASLQIFLQEVRNWRVSLSPGLRLRELEPYTKLRLRRSAALGDWRSRFEQTFEWFESSGFGTKTNQEFDRRLGETSLLRLTTQAYHNEGDYRAKDFELSQRIRLFFALDRQTGLSTEAGVFGRTEPNWHHERYFTNLSWRRDIHRGYVFFEIKPQLDFRRDDNFAAEASLTLSLEVLYGAEYRVF